MCQSGRERRGLRPAVEHLAGCLIWGALDTRFQRADLLSSNTGAACPVPGALPRKAVERKLAFLTSQAPVPLRIQRVE
jgi:hypothetical protein